MFTGYSGPAVVIDGPPESTRGAYSLEPSGDVLAELQRAMRARLSAEIEVGYAYHIHHIIVSMSYTGGLCARQCRPSVGLYWLLAMFVTILDSSLPALLSRAPYFACCNDV